MTNVLEILIRECAITNDQNPINKEDTLNGEPIIHIPGKSTGVMGRPDILHLYENASLKEGRILMQGSGILRSISVVQEGITSCGSVINQNHLIGYIDDGEVYYKTTQAFVNKIG